MPIEECFCWSEENRTKWKAKREAQKVSLKITGVEAVGAEAEAVMV